MRIRLLWFFLVISAFAASVAGQQPKNDASSGTVTKVPKGVILVKGAWSSASDSVTPVPEGGNVSGGVFRDAYFGISYPLRKDWIQKYQGPPPSDTGRYVLAELSPAETFKGAASGTMLITAEDMFFATAPISTAAESIDYMKVHLQSDYKVDSPPQQIEIARRPFTFFAYWSPAAQLHWYVLATDIRCHVVQIVLTSRDVSLLGSLMRSLEQMKLPAEGEGGVFPTCIKDYARAENMIARTDPVFTGHRYNPVPVRIVIDKAGRVRHIHSLSAFADQSEAIYAALRGWRFKPYVRSGQPMEVETGMLFGAPAR